MQASVCLTISPSGVMLSLSKSTSIAKRMVSGIFNDTSTLATDFFGLTSPSSAAIELAQTKADIIAISNLSVIFFSGYLSLTSSLPSSLCQLWSSSSYSHSRSIRACCLSLQVRFQRLPGNIGSIATTTGLAAGITTCYPRQ